MIHASVWRGKNYSLLLLVRLIMHIQGEWREAINLSSPSLTQLNNSHLGKHVCGMQTATGARWTSHAVCRTARFQFYPQLTGQWAKGYEPVSFMHKWNCTWHIYVSWAVFVFFCFVFFSLFLSPPSSVLLPPLTHALICVLTVYFIFWT